MPINAAVSSTAEESPVRQHIDDLLKAPAFWRTRRAILRGEEVYDLSPEMRLAGGFLEPWKFNLYASAIAAAPTIALMSALKFVFALPSDPAPVTVADFAGEWIEKPLPLIFALLTTFSASILARASLRRSDRSPDRMARAKRAYLYLDGAWNLFPQIVVIFVFTFLFSIGPLPEFTTIGLLISVATRVMATYAGMWMLLTSTSKIPRLLFAANGYLPTDPAPRVAYRIAVVVVIPIVGLALFIAAFVATYFAAEVLLRVRASIHALLTT